MPFFHPRICSLANLETADRNNFQGSHISPVQPGWLVLFPAVLLVIVVPSSFLTVLPVLKGKNSTVSSFFLRRLLQASDLLKILRCPCTQSHFWTPKSLSPYTCHSTFFWQALQQQQQSPSWMSLYHIPMGVCEETALLHSVGSCHLCLELNKPEAVLPHFLTAFSTCMTLPRKADRHNSGHQSALPYFH